MLPVFESNVYIILTRPGYPEIAEESLGRVWAGVVRAATIVSCLGGCTGNDSFLADNRF
jgi:hypothetical protein